MTSYDAWAPVYDAWSADMTEDLPFYVELARDADGPVVELAVGNGRVAIPVARAIGRRVVGIDSSPAMLAEARRRADQAGVDLDLRLADMRDVELEEPASLIYVPYRSLLHLPTWHDKRRVFERVAASLRTGGRFAFNAFVFHPKIAAGNDGTTQNANGVVHTIHHVPSDNRIDLVRDTGATIRLWWATRSEWEGLLDVAGLETEALHGWFDRRPFGDESPEFVYVTRKP